MPHADLNNICLTHKYLIITSGSKSRKVTLGVAFDKTTLVLISVPSSNSTPFVSLLSTMMLETD
jgi:hypothetical protein